MKIVKEHIIFEKFTKDSDPIADMGIGIMKQIKEFIEWFRPNYEQHEYIIACAIKGEQLIRYTAKKIYNPLVWLQYLLEHKIYTQDSLEEALMFSIWYNEYKSIKVITQYSDIDLNKKMNIDLIFNSKYKNEEYPLVYATRGANIRTILTLIKCGAKIDVIGSKYLKLIQLQRPALYRELQKIRSKNKLKNK